MKYCKEIIIMLSPIKLISKKKQYYRPKDKIKKTLYNNMVKWE